MSGTRSVLSRNHTFPDPQPPSSDRRLASAVLLVSMRSGQQSLRLNTRLSSNKFGPLYSANRVGSHFTCSSKLAPCTAGCSSAFSMLMIVFSRHLLVINYASCGLIMYRRFRDVSGLQRV